MNHVPHHVTGSVLELDTSKVGAGHVVFSVCDITIHDAAERQVVMSVRRRLQIPSFSSKRYDNWRKRRESWRMGCVLIRLIFHAYHVRHCRSDPLNITVSVLKSRCIM